MDERALTTIERVYRLIDNNLSIFVDKSDKEGPGVNMVYVEDTPHKSSSDTDSCKVKTVYSKRGSYIFGSLFTGKPGCDVLDGYNPSQDIAICVFLSSGTKDTVYNISVIPKKRKVYESQNTQCQSLL